MTNVRPRDVQVLPIGESTLVLRSRSWNRLRFEIEYALEKGTTANSYVIQGEDITVIDPPGGTFREIYLTALQERIDLRQIKYVICQHVNPNRAETLHALLKLAPQICFVASNLGVKNLRSILESNYGDTLLATGLQTITVKGDDSLAIGGGHVLQFILTPTPATQTPSVPLIAKQRFCLVINFLGRTSAATKCMTRAVRHCWQIGVTILTA